MITRKGTKDIMVESMLELMSRKPLNKITVAMIVSNCNITRQTFYYHFKDKYELVNWIFKMTIDEITSSSSLEKPWCEVLGEMLFKMKEHQKFYINAIDYRGQNSFQSYITEYTRQAYIKELKKRVNEKDLDDELLFSIEFNSYAASGIIMQWIENRMSMNPRILAKRIADNMPELMKAFFC